MSYILGLDLGQTNDFSALAIVGRPAASEEPPVHTVPHLQRWPLGTPYTQIVSDTLDLLDREELKGSPLVVDQTGVGRPVVDLFRKGPRTCWTVPVTITGGHAVTQTEDHSYHVPKKELVSCLRLLLEQRRLQIARALPEAAVLEKEMQNFQVKITLSANEQFGAWREGAHDDLVLATALACWWAEKSWAPPFKVSEDRVGRSIWEDVPEGVFLTPLFPERREHR